MGRPQSPEEVKQDHLSKLGLELGTAFHTIWNEVLNMHLKWTEFESLFGSEENVSLMHQISPNFFFILRNLLFNDIVMGITRLTQKKIDRIGNERLTLSVLTQLTEPPLKGEVHKKVRLIEKEASFCNDIRNRKIAHFDRSLALGSSQKPLESATRDEINAVLKMIADLLNTIQFHYIGSRTEYRFWDDSGSQVVQLAKRGIDFHNVRLKILREKGIDLENYLAEDEN